MILRPGNLVRHKSGGPIMMVDDLVSREQFKGMFGFHYAPHDCTWLENGVKKIGSFRASELQSVYADGTRNTQKLRRRSVNELPLMARTGPPVMSAVWSLSEE